MDFVDILTLILAIVSGLGAAIPLVIQLVKYIRIAIKSKNWGALLNIVLQLMAEAEDNYKTGAEREEYVIDSIKAMESTLDCDIDETQIREMIAAIAKASKKINVNKK